MTATSTPNIEPKPSKPVPIRTLNNRLGYLRSVFNVLHQLSEIDYANPLARVRPLRLQEKELAYLTDGQIETLFSTIHRYCRTPHVAMVAAICLATGARWGEAQALTPDRVRNQLVTFVNTKGKRVRSIPIALELEQQIHRHFKQHGQFSNCLNSFDKALGESRLPVPAGQSSHVLRHTFASHFVMNGGNISPRRKSWVIPPWPCPCATRTSRPITCRMLSDSDRLAITNDFSASSPRPAECFPVPGA